MTTPSDNPDKYALGVMGVKVETYRHQRDRLADTLEYLIAAMDGGHQWDIDAAIHGATLTLKTLKDRP